MTDLLKQAASLLNGQRRLVEAQQSLDFEVAPLLWDQLSRSIEPAERDEIRSMIGFSLVQNNEILHEELTALLEIFAGLMTENDHREAKLQQLSTLHTRSTPERELLVTEIRFVVQNIREHAQLRGEDGHDYINRKIVDIATPREQTMLNCAAPGLVSAGGPSGRPVSGPETVGSRPGTSRRPATAARTRPSSQNGRPGCTGTLLREPAPRLHMLEMDKVTQRMQKALQEEHKALLEDVGYIRLALEEESSYNIKAREDPTQLLGALCGPSINELRQYGTKLKERMTEEQLLLAQHSLLKLGPNSSEREPEAKQNLDDETGPGLAGDTHEADDLGIDAEDLMFFDIEMPPPKPKPTPTIDHRPPKTPSSQASQDSPRRKPAVTARPPRTPLSARGTSRASSSDSSASSRARSRIQNARNFAY